MDIEVVMAEILGELYEEYKKGEEALWESVNAKRIGVDVRVFVQAGEELKRQGYLPQFADAKANGKPVISYIGVPSDEAMKLFKEMLDEENK